MSHRHGPAQPAELLLRFAHLFTAGLPAGEVLDLACGDGRNGLFLAGLGVPVVLADRDTGPAAAALETAGQVAGRPLPARLWRVDLESGGDPLAGMSFAGIVVFRYLHRPLLPSILRAVAPGGVLVYETFTVEQRRFGRPTNPDYLLRPGELAEAFAAMAVIHAFEGVTGEPERAVAQLAARRPPAP